MHGMLNVPLLNYWEAPFYCLCLGCLAIEDLITNCAAWTARHHGFHMFWVASCKTLWTHQLWEPSDAWPPTSRILISEMSFRFPSSHFHLLLYEVVKPEKTSVWRGNRLLEDLVCTCSVWEFHGHQRLSRNTGFPSKHLTIPEDPLLHDWPHSSWFTFCLLEPLV